MYCGKCGTKIDDDSKFCIACGSPVESTVLESTDSANEKIVVNADPATTEEQIPQNIETTPDTYEKDITAVSPVNLQKQISSENVIATVEETFYCKNCRKQMDNDTDLCEECKKQTNIDIDTSDMDIDTSDTDIHTSNKEIYILCFGIASVLLSLCLIFNGVFLIGRSTNDLLSLTIQKINNEMAIVVVVTIIAIVCSAIGIVLYNSAKNDLYEKIKVLKIGGILSIINIIIAILGCIFNINQLNSSRSFVHSNNDDIQQNQATSQYTPQQSVENVEKYISEVADGNRISTCINYAYTDTDYIYRNIYIVCTISNRTSDTLTFNANDMFELDNHGIIVNGSSDYDYQKLGGSGYSYNITVVFRCPQNASYDISTMSVKADGVKINLDMPNDENAKKKFAGAYYSSNGASMIYIQDMYNGSYQAIYIAHFTLDGSDTPYINIYDVKLNSDNTFVFGRTLYKWDSKNYSIGNADGDSLQYYRK